MKIIGKFIGRVLNQNSSFYYRKGRSKTGKGCSKTGEAVCKQKRDVQKQCYNLEYLP